MSEELAAFRDRMPGCSIVAFADFSTGMVLASSTAEKTTQEKLDALCAIGRDALTGDFAKQVSTAFPGREQRPLRLALRADGGGIRCFVHADYPAQEALCCVLTSGASLSDVVREAQALLDRTASEG